MHHAVAKFLAAFAFGRWLRFVWFAFRRAYLCPKGKHGDYWHYFGRSRVCRVCHREEWLAADGWHSAANHFAESAPSWHHTHPQDAGTADDAGIPG